MCRIFYVVMRSGMLSGNYDSGGCFSGSAMVNNDTLTVCYNGNPVYRDGSRTSWQCLAREKPDGGFEKYGSAPGLPEGYSADVSNPKVWQHRYWQLNRAEVA